MRVRGHLLRPRLLWVVLSAVRNGAGRPYANDAACIVSHPAPPPKAHFETLLRSNRDHDLPSPQSWAAAIGGAGQRRAAHPSKPLIDDPAQAQRPSVSTACASWREAPTSPPAPRLPPQNNGHRRALAARNTPQRRGSRRSQGWLPTGVEGSHRDPHGTGFPSLPMPIRKCRHWLGGTPPRVSLFLTCSARLGTKPRSSGLLPHMASSRTVLAEPVNGV